METKQEYKIHEEGCLKLLPEIKSNSVDMILTDPPYGMNFVSNHRKNKYDKIKNDDGCLDWLDEVSKQSYRISKNNTAHYIFCSYHNIDLFKQAFEKNFQIKNILIWEKNNTSMGDLTGNFASKTEFILFIQKGRPLIRGKRDSNILKFNRTANEIHPTQKPINLNEYLISKFSDELDLICDPFMGSGSSMAACRNLNRNYMGFEISDEWESNYKRILTKKAETETRKNNINKWV